MAQVIIYTNNVGGVSITIPSGEIPIEQVLIKDCPVGAIIVDEFDLPQDAEFFNAWVLNNGVVTVDKTKKQAIITAKQAPIDAKTSALSKLSALGLTDDEIKALLGVSA
jgi:hypothetical protein